MNTLKQWMLALGKLEAEDIRKLLVATNSKGFKRSALCCPISNFLEKVLHCSFTTGTSSVSAMAHGGDDWSGVPIPDSVSVFIHNFDDNLYPELIKQVGYV